MRIRSFLCVAACLGCFGATAAIGQPPAKVHIGMVPSLMADLSDGQKKFIGDEFPLLVKDFTGLPGQLDKAESAKELGDKMLAGPAQFGVFQGIEFAETQAKYPELQPLLLSIYRSPQIKAVLVTKKDAAFKSFAELAGKDVALLKEGKEHIRRYAMKEAGSDPAKFFGNVVVPANSEAALDAILLNKVQAALVDNSTLEIYKDVNPGRFNKLKVIGESAPFPPAVIAYAPKKIDAALVKQFKDGMMKANESAKGRDIMGTFKISSFVAVPAEFEKSLAEIRKAYPE